MSRSPTCFRLCCVVAAGVLLLVGCTGVNKDFVRASRAYYDATAPELRRYIMNDSTLDNTDKSRRLELVDEYGRTLMEAEK